MISGMPEAVARYLETIAELSRVAGRCDGLIADVAFREQALRRWQECVSSGGPIEALEGALGEVFAGEPPSWPELRRELGAWVAVAKRARGLWEAVPAEDRLGLQPPVVR
jgi:hypothetical protein